MKENRYIFWPTLIFPVVQLFVSNEVFWMIGFISLCFIVVFKNNWRFTIPFPEYIIMIVFILWGMLLGLAHFFFSAADIRDFVRDIFYYSTSIIYIYHGSWYAKKVKDSSRIYNSFIVSGAIVSIISLYRIYRSTGVFTVVSSLHEWRSSTSGGAIIIGVSLAIAFSGIIPKAKSLPNMLKLVCLSLSSLFFIMALSRTNLFIIVILYITLVLRKDNAQRILSRMILSFIIIIGGIWLTTILLPNHLLAEYGKKVLSSLTEISTNNSWDNARTVQNNWRGYENYCALEQWKTSDTFTQIFGAGFGKRIYVGSYAYTLLGQLFSNGSPADAIAVLHNGYATQLIKLGIVGVVVYILLYLSIIWKGVKYLHYSEDGRVLLAVGLTFLIQTLFLNGLFRDYCFYPLIILLGYTYSRAKASFDNNPGG